MPGYGCTPPKAVAILFRVKAYMENRHFRVFIMIRIGQALVFLTDHVQTIRCEDILWVVFSN